MSLHRDLTGRSAKTKGETTPPVAGDRFFNRDLSWLHFNDRVLSEAADPSVPLLERLRFATIVSSNLDEFFMVRVAELVRKAKRHRAVRSAVFSLTSRVLPQIRSHVLQQKATQASVVRGLFTALAKEGILIYSDFEEDPDLDREIKARMPELKFIIRRAHEPPPPLLSDRIHVFIRFPEEYAIVSIERRRLRLLRLPTVGRTYRFVLLERWLTARAAQLFPNREVLEAFPFKLIRDADLRYRPDEEETLEVQIVEAVQRRSRAKIVRLEVDAPSYSEGALSLATSLGLDSAALYRFNLPLDLRTLAILYNAKGFGRLRYPPVRPEVPVVLRSKNTFNAVRARDVLLHHPYDSFDVIVRFLRQAARDPNVVRITHTMYRTSQESPIMEALKHASRMGKKVTVYIEIKARFDELNNVWWANELRKAGVKVVRPLGGYKVHCKLTQVIRREHGKDVSYLHLGTGNYHPGTARQYTDLGLLTADPQLGTEISSYFSSLTRHSKPARCRELMVAPRDLHTQYLQLIKEETAIQRRGGKGHIIAKMNSLVDPDIINALYAASRAGVKIELLVRGICCLRPGVKNLSENIRVISVIDRFLEHSRIYYFRANGSKKVYLASADWMPRNFYLRYEVAFPVKDPVLKKYIREVVLANGLGNNVKGWVLKSDGTYERVHPPAGGKAVRSQFLFEALARSRYRGTILAARERK